MNLESLHKLYQHFIRCADVHKYHGNLGVLSGLMRVQESSLREVMDRMHEYYDVQFYWFSEQDFIADVTPHSQQS